MTIFKQGWPDSVYPDNVYWLQSILTSTPDSVYTFNVYTFNVHTFNAYTFPKYKSFQPPRNVSSLGILQFNVYIVFFSFLHICISTYRYKYFVICTGRLSTDTMTLHLNLQKLFIHKHISNCFFISTYRELHDMFHLFGNLFKHVSNTHVQNVFFISAYPQINSFKRISNTFNYIHHYIYISITFSKMSAFLHIRKCSFQIIVSHYIRSK